MTAYPRPLHRMETKPTRAASCDGKDQMPAQTARDVAGRMRRQHRVAVEAYRCPFCNHWHVGRPPA